MACESVGFMLITLAIEYGLFASLFRLVCGCSVRWRRNNADGSDQDGEVVENEDVGVAAERAAAADPRATVWWCRLTL